MELFVDPTSPAATTRAKEAALLYERLTFETGLLDVTIGKTGSSSFWLPASSLTPERLKASRVPVQIGAPFSLSIGVEPTPGQAPERMTTMISTPVTLAFRAEWETGILDELAEFEPDWVHVIETGGGDPPTSDPVGQQIAEQNALARRDHSLLPDYPTHQRDFIYKAFNRDSSIAAALGAAFSLTPLFDEMVRRRSVVPLASGDQALSILVPNVGSLPWEAVLEFRDHPGCHEARQMLRGFEQRAAESEPADALEYLRSISQQATFAYAQALEDLRPKLGEELALEAVKTAISFMPAAGPIIEKAASLTQLVRADRRERRSWTAAIMRLQRQI